MKALITGGAGFIGSNLTHKLVDMGWEIVVVDDLSSGRISNINELAVQKKIKLYAGVDFASPMILEAVKSGTFDVIFHLAAIPRVAYSVEHPSETTDVNVLRSIKLLEACREVSSMFIFASSSSVYGGADVLPTSTTYPKHPKSPYALQKSTVEDYITMFCELYGLNAVSLRYFNVFGPSQYGDSAYSTAISAWCHAIKSNLPLRSDGTGEQTRDLCYVDNVIDVNIRAATCGKKFKGEKFNVACGDQTSNNQILEAFKNRFANLKIVNAPARLGDVLHTKADISLTTETFGYTPIVRFWDGFERTLKWWGL